MEASMKADDYHELVRRIGQEVLLSKAFEYRQKNWHYIVGQRQISLLSGNTRFGIGFAIKYLTIALVDLDLPLANGTIPKRYRGYDGTCVIQISPMVIQTWAKSGFKDSAWHYTPTWVNGQIQLACYHPVYYGGPNRWSPPEALRFGGMASQYRDEATAVREIRQCIEHYGTYSATFSKR